MCACPVRSGHLLHCDHVSPLCKPGTIHAAVCHFLDPLELLEFMTFLKQLDLGGIFSLLYMDLWCLLYSLRPTSNPAFPGSLSKLFLLPSK